MQLRIAWGGGAERLWKGTIRLSQGTLAEPQPLGIEADEPGTMWLEDGQLQIVSRSPRAYDGVDLKVFAPPDARLTVALWPADQSPPEKPVEMTISDLAGSFKDASLDDRKNRLLIRRAPGDMLRIRLENRDSMVFYPGETLRLDLLPRLLGAGGAKVRFEMQLTAAKGGQSSWSEERELAVDDAAPPSVPLEVKLPMNEGVYDLQITARTRGRLRLWQNLAERKLQLVVLDPGAIPAPLTGDRPLNKVAEIDPAEPHNPAWWNRFGQLTMLPAFKNKGPLGTGEATTWQHPQLNEKLIQLGSGGREPTISWEAYPLPIDRPGEPHVLEIDYPSDVPQSLGISIVEPNASGAVLPIGLDSGVYVPDEAAQETPRLEKHRLTFWPRTRSPLVLLTNRRDGSRAVFGRMRLYTGLPRLPRAFSREEPSERLWAAYLDRPLFPENFSAPDALDTWSGRSLDDWSTFYEGGVRTADYLNHIGYNGLLLSVLADGSTIYPSRVLEPTPRYDTGMFFGTGQDPFRKDVLELLLRVFDREQLKLVPLVQLASPLPEIETLLRKGGADAVGLEWTGADGSSWRQRIGPNRGLGAYYNVLHPRVQEAVLSIVRELTTRYGNHRALAGLALDVSTEGYAVLPGVDWGFDDVTIAAFQQAHPQLRIPGIGPARFAERARYLTGEQRTAWAAWRADQLQKFYGRIQADLTRARPEATLYLSGASMFASRPMQQAWRPQLPQQARIDQLLLELGLRPSGEEPAAGVLLRPQRLAPIASLTSQGVNLQINHSLELDRIAAGEPTTAAVFYHEPQEARLESFDAKSPFKRTYSWLLSQPAPSGQENRKRFTHALAAYDVQQMFDGGALMPLGQEAAFKGLISSYRRLPAQKFETLANCPQPVMLRVLKREEGSWFYAVNDSPWSVEVRVPITVPQGSRLQQLDLRRPTPQLESDARGGLLKISLEPYDMAGGWLAASRITWGLPTVQLPPQAVPQLEARMKDLEARHVALNYPRPLEDWPVNRGFEDAATSDAEIPGWSFPGRTAALDRSQPREGSAQSVRLNRVENDAEAWLRSDPLPVPKTGRLAISVWLRVADVRRQPAVRLAAEWQADGRTEYRYAALGQSQFGEKYEPIPEVWKQYVFSVTDLPAEGISQLRVRLDLMNRGDVFVDDVQLYDLIFDPKTERTELLKMIWHYTGQLQRGQVGDCLHFLESYWPRYLTAHVPLVQDPAAPPPRTAAQPKRPNPDKEEKKPGFFDRLKGLVPDRMWF